jgi:photosystem II stability/assembly factor-like uncharacterized protein
MELPMPSFRYPRRLFALTFAGVLVLASGASAQDLLNQTSDPLLRGFRWRSIGPAGQGGRVDDIEAIETDPATFYVGFATGGLWKTTNRGITFEPVFDSYGTHSIGDIAIAPSNPDVVYVGTGEPNNRQSSSFGEGVYKTTDGGKTFSHVGLRNTQSIARVVVHPSNPDIVWVAAKGHLFGPNPDRGVFLTTDGGRNWTKTLYVDDNTGATDLIIHPANPQILFAATYQRQRTAWGFASGGSASGIWRSVDGGRNWTRIRGNGLPEGTMGRIGLAISRSNPDIVYIQAEVAPDKEPQDRSAAPSPGGPGGGGFGQQNQPPDDKVSGVWRSDDGGNSWSFMSNENNRPMYYSQIRVDPNDPMTVYVGGQRASKSVDGGKTFEPMQGMGHVDNHAIWVDPSDSRHVMYGNDGSVDVSWDGGENWESLRTWAVGQPYHASVDMRHPYYVCTGLQDNGSWCGPSSARSGSILAQDWYRVGGGDGFYTLVDPTDPNVIYSESQNGNVRRVDLRTGETISIRPRVGGGGGGFGGGGSPNIVPVPTDNPQIRWNWNTPLVMSAHDASTIYAGGNYLFISRDRGTTWTMTADLTKSIEKDDREILGMKGTTPRCSRQRTGACIHSRNDGVNAYGTIVSISESSITPSILWVGTDDGNIQVSRDGGMSWSEVGRNLPGGPKEYYVSRVEASHFDRSTAYASLDGHRSDDLTPYVFVTHDYGATWSAITNGLPPVGNVNTVREDPRNANLLYVGTEFGVYVSLDAGANWKRFMSGLPVVRIDDILVHPRENDLVLSTHGRSIWIMDDVTALQQVAGTTSCDPVLFQPRNAVRWKQDVRQQRSVTGAKLFQGENAPRGTAIGYYLPSAARGDVKITIRELGSDSVFRTIDGTGEAGLNRLQWDLCSDPRPVQQGQGGFGGGGCGGGGFGGGGQQGPRRVARLADPGSYVVTLEVGGQEYSKGVTVLEDTWLDER